MPAFYAQTPVIQLHDPLAELLGAAEDGRIEYRYSDAVRLAGHSCPTVAGAFLMARAGLRTLYPGALPERGSIEVTMSSAEAEGTTGVIAQVFTLITGAAAGNGFHGIGSNFVRHGLLRYGSGDARSVATFRHIDSGDTVHVSMDLSRVPAAPQIRALMAQALTNDATPAERAAFAAAWQERVRRLMLEHADDPATIRVARLD